MLHALHIHCKAAYHSCLALALPSCLTFSLGKVRAQFACMWGHLTGLYHWTGLLSAQGLAVSLEGKPLARLP